MQIRREEWWLNYLRGEIESLEKSRPSFWRGIGILAPSVVSLIVGVFQRIEWSWWIILILMVLGGFFVVVGAIYFIKGVWLKNQKIDRQITKTLALIDEILMGIDEKKKKIPKRWEEIRKTDYPNPL